MRNTYLIGMMGSGKSVTAAALAERLHCDVIDLDSVLEQKLKLGISQVFALKGERFFREEEARILKEYSVKEGVFATGGGIILKKENIDRMKATGIIVYLDTPLEWLWSRVRHKSNRPLLQRDYPKETLAKILKSRQRLYLSCADYVVHTGGKTASEVAAEIEKILKDEKDYG